MIPAIKFGVEVACPMLPTGNKSFYRCGRGWPAKSRTKAEIVVIPAKVHAAMMAGDAKAKAALSQAYADGAVTEAALAGLRNEPILAVQFLSQEAVELRPVVAEVEKANRSVLEEIAEELGEAIEVEEPKGKTSKDVPKDGRK